MIRALVLVFVLSSSLFADSKNQVFSDFTTSLPLPEGDTLIVGIVGGWERWDAPQRIVRRVALKIRDRNIPGVHVETVENHKPELAEELITKAFPDKSKAKLILYGNSLGGSATVRLAKRLDDLGIPVLMAVIVDSFGKGGKEIPANVAAAVNLYQRDNWPVVGEPKIIAADPEHTKILGNFKFSYKGKDIDVETEPWVRRTFTRGHLMMEYDPEVWRIVENYLLNATPQRAQTQNAPAGRLSSAQTATSPHLP